MTRILALDLARVSGLAFRDETGKVRTSTLTLGGKRDVPALGYIRLQSELTRLFECVPFDLLSIEADTDRNPETTRTLRGYHTAAAMAAAPFGIPVRHDIGASSARMLALGQGNGGMSKEDAASAAWTLHGVEADTLDEVDATILLIATERLLLAEAAERAFAPVGRVTAKQRKAFAKRVRARAAAMEFAA